MIKKVLIATTNEGKVLEFKEILENFDFLTLKNFPKIESPLENGKTFKENAEIKANFYFNHFKMPVIVEDSGFCVEELGGLPGVDSANWGEGGNFTNAINRIYKMLDGKPSLASFVSLIAYKASDGIIFAKGEVLGTISPIAKGENGFGFDPCFIPSGFTKTFGEMSRGEKSLISQRKIAITNLLKQI
jgi:XTP/dITP diphosphohydrolase